MRYNPKAKLDPSQVEIRRTPAKPPKLRTMHVVRPSQQVVGHPRGTTISFPAGVPTQTTDKPDGADGTGVRKSMRMKRHGR